MQLNKIKFTKTPAMAILLLASLVSSQVLAEDSNAKTAVGGGLGAAAGAAVVGKVITEPGKSSSSRHHHKHGKGHAYGHDKHD